MDNARHENASQIQPKDNVVCFEEQKSLRATKNAPAEIESGLGLEEVTCEDGLCLVTWKPQRPAA